MSIYNIVKSFDLLDNIRHYDLMNHMDNMSAMNSSKEFEFNNWQSYSRVEKNERGYTIITELPGLSRSDIEINLKGSTLTIEAHRDDSKNNHNKNQYSYTYKQHFKRSWAIPETCIEDSIAARYEAGVLYVDVPLRAEKIRKIEVE